MSALAEGPVIQPVFQQPFVRHRHVLERPGASAMGLSAGSPQVASIISRAVPGMFQQGGLGLADPAREGLGFPAIALASRRRPLSSAAPLAGAMSTSVTPESSVLLKRVELAFERGETEIFEYGVESELARTITLLLDEHGAAGLNAITTVMRSSLVGDEVGSEAFRRLGSVDNHLTVNDRIRFLAHELETHPSPRRRYAAAAALADMNEPAGIKALRTAADHEALSELKQRFRRLLQLLSY